MLLALPKYLMPWGIQGLRAHYDYVCPDHLLSEMMNDAYFGVPWPANFKQGDLIYVIDGAMEEAVLRVDGAYKDERKVVLSLREVHAFKPAIKANSEEKEPPTWTVRYKGRRGGEWCILDPQGLVVEKGYESRGEAERRLKNMIEASKKAS